MSIIRLDNINPLMWLQKTRCLTDVSYLYIARYQAVKPISGSIRPMH